MGPGVQRLRPRRSDKRLPYDPDAAKKLLAEAGYPNGFGVTLDCPNDRYVNDEAICQAVTAMLARIGIKITLDAQTRLKYFAEISNPDYHTSFYMLGWTPSTYDAHNALFNLLGTRNGTRGVFNDGGWSNKEFDDLLDKIAVETDPAKRQDDDQRRVQDRAWTRWRPSRCTSRRSCGRRSPTSTWCSSPTTPSRCASSREVAGRGAAGRMPGQRLGAAPDRLTGRW